MSGLTVYDIGWAVLLGGFIVFCLLWAWLGHVLTKRTERERAEVQRRYRRDASRTRYFQ